MHGRLVQVVDESLSVELAFGQSVVAPGNQVVELDNLRSPGPVGGNLLGDLKELLLGKLGALDADSTVLGLFGVGEDADDSVANGAEQGGGPDVVAAINEGGLVLLVVEDEAVLETPVEEDVVVD